MCFVWLTMQRGTVDSCKIIHVGLIGIILHESTFRYMYRYMLISGKVISCIFYQIMNITELFIFKQLTANVRLLF